jgi:hypothetical protein
MTVRRVWMLAATVGVIVSISVLVRAPPSAFASADQVSIIQDSSRMLADPSGTLATFRALGVNTVRVIVVWAQIAPDWEDRAPPSAFEATDPAAYPEANWAPYDAIVK